MMKDKNVEQGKIMLTLNRFISTLFITLWLIRSTVMAAEAPQDPKAKLMTTLKADLKKGKKPSKNEMEELIAKQGKAFICSFTCSKEAMAFGLVDCKNEDQSTPFSHGFCASCMKIVQDPKTKAEVALTVFACNAKTTKERSSNSQQQSGGTAGTK